MKKQYETKVITPDTKDEKPDEHQDIRHDGKPKEGGFPKGSRQGSDDGQKPGD